MGLENYLGVLYGTEQNQLFLGVKLKTITKIHRIQVIHCL